MYIRLIRWPGRRHGVCTEALGAKCGTLRHPFAVAVQWHPEWKVMSNLFSRALFAAFGAASRERAEAKK